MKIGIIYNKAFQLISVFQQPMSYGSAAVGYLAINLTKLGHEVTIFSQQSNNVGLYDVRCRNISIQNEELHLDKAMLEANFDAFILKDEDAEFLINIKNALPYKPKIYLWTELDYDNPVNQCLANKEVVNLLDGIVCVSQWQRYRFIDSLGVDHNKLDVKFYAISPMYENLFMDEKELIATKSKSPLFAYTAPATDGLDTMLEILPDVTMNYGNAMLDIFCDLLTSDKEHKNEDIFKKANRIANVAYMGSLTRVKLASMLRKYSILPYPARVADTSCVYVLEAMAAGMYVLTSDAGSIPEYMLGRGKCIQDEDLLSESLNSFASQLLSICQIQTASSPAFFEYCYKQYEEINKQHTWYARAREWVSYLKGEDKQSQSDDLTSEEQTMRESNG